MRFRIPFAIFLSCILFFPFYSNGQGETPEKDHIGYISAYVSVPFGILTNLSYDYLKPGKKSYHGLTMGLTYQFWEFGEGSFGPHLTYTFLSGVDKKNHFEFKAGGAAYIFADSFIDASFIPVITLGYRYQPPDGKGFFRIAFSTAGLGIGAGYKIN
jgi:hypothetical protein